MEQLLLFVMFYLVHATIVIILVENTIDNQKPLQQFFTDFILIQYS